MWCFDEWPFWKVFQSRRTFCCVGPHLIPILFGAGGAVRGGGEKYSGNQLLKGDPFLGKDMQPWQKCKAREQSLRK